MIIVFSPSCMLILCAFGHEFASADHDEIMDPDGPGEDAMGKISLEA